MSADSRPSRLVLHVGLPKTRTSKVGDFGCHLHHTIGVKFSHESISKTTDAAPVTATSAMPLDGAISLPTVGGPGLTQQSRFVASRDRHIRTRSADPARSA